MHPPLANVSLLTGMPNAMSEAHPVHATFYLPKPPSRTRQRRCHRKHRAGRRGPESALRLKASLAAKAVASRKAWEAFYEKKDPRAAAPKPGTAELSAGLARALFTPSMVRALEERFELQPGELTSGVVTVLRMAKRSMQAEATIYDPRRKRYVSAVVELLTLADLAAVADAFRLLKEWRLPPRGKAENEP